MIHIVTNRKKNKVLFKIKSKSKNKVTPLMINIYWFILKKSEVQYDTQPNTCL